MTTISVIIPLSKDEIQHKELLKTLPNDMEIILSLETDRASSLNDGAEKAREKYLWFLHADSRLSDNVISSLNKAIEQFPNALLYFDIAFNDGNFLMRLNQWGANFRSRVLKIPFGDQGFCIRKDLFEKLGGFPQGLAYGEDHMFVRQARQQGIDIQPIGAKLYTSARKYQKHGWLKTTIMHQYMWIKQAVTQ